MNSEKKIVRKSPANPEGRPNQDMRPVAIESGVNRYAEGSVLVKFGHTHVFCTASIEERVPPWLEGKGQGWVTGEYSMLPRSTHTRSRRERDKVSGRTQEIQRLIGRALRGTVDLKKIGERTITIDCDVLQADGGTRTASITGGFVALTLALGSLIQKNIISAAALMDTVSAVSLGIQGDHILVDLDYNEDSTCDVDMNFVITGKEKFVEVQGTAERMPFDSSQLNQMTQAALEAARHLRSVQKQAIIEAGYQNLGEIFS